MKTEWLQKEKTLLLKSRDEKEEEMIMKKPEDLE